MKKSSFHILRVGLAITFLWIGILILKQPEAWGGYIQPWAMRLLPIPAAQAMIGTAFLDIVIGVFILIDSFVWLAALAGTAHLIIVLAVSGITDITVRDIAILAGTLALLVDSFPQSFINKIQAGDSSDQGRSR
jgi:uncharacterized membrane protein YphA (DoxX/SURF4 family)